MLHSVGHEPKANFSPLYVSCIWVDSSSDDFIFKQTIIDWLFCGVTAAVQCVMAGLLSFQWLCTGCSLTTAVWVFPPAVFCWSCWMSVCPSCWWEAAVVPRVAGESCDFLWYVTPTVCQFIGPAPPCTDGTTYHTHNAECVLFVQLSVLCKSAFTA